VNGLLERRGADDSGLTGPPRPAASLRLQVALWTLAAAGLGAAAAILWLGASSATEGDAAPHAGVLRGLAAFALAVAAGLLAWANGHRAARPWRSLETALRERAGEDLRPLPAGGPTEARPGLEALNGWVERRRAVEERQRRLLGDASHQLRTPLAVLRTVLQSTPPQTLGERRDELLRTVDRTTAVVDEMLARMKLDQRRAEGGAAAALRLDEAAREAAIEFAPLIGARRLHFALEATAVEVRADAWMLGELVRNLLANAIRHTPGEGTLGIVVRAVPLGPELIVWDSGPGLREGARERLFEPFAAASGGGIGLGLSICRDLAQAMGAQVELFNRTDGHRATGVDAVVRWPAPAPSTSPFPTPLTTGDPR
jgi:two-component system sensor histidine kinase TctE